MNYPLPANEAKRLKVLWEYQILDTVPEALFDDLTELAALITEAPMAIISLVDSERQWFKAKVGMDTKETARDISFCAHAISQPDLFIVANATLDPRFADNPLVVSEPGIRFYAGAPLVTPDGYALGTLCVLDRVPRQLRAEQKSALRLLARVIMSQLELRRKSIEAQQGQKPSIKVRRVGRAPERKKTAADKRRRTA